MRALLFTLLAAGLMAGCASTPVQTSAAPRVLDSAIVGTNWVLVSPSAPRPPTLAFADDGANGFGGCNRWFGQWFNQGGAFTFGSLGATRMMCDAPAMDAERAFFAALNNTRSAEITQAQQLVLRNEAGAEVARFARAPTGS